MWLRTQLRVHALALRAHDRCALGATTPLGDAMWWDGRQGGVCLQLGVTVPLVTVTYLDSHLKKILSLLEALCDR